MTYLSQKAISLGRLPLANLNAVVLATCNALFICAISIDLTLTGLTGYQLAPEKALATLPFSLITVVSALVTLFASLFMQRFGRRIGFIVGAATGAAGGIISTWAVLHHRFWIFCLGTGAVGVFQAFAQYYRLAAADSVPANAKGKAISTVLTGGVIAAVIGPAIAAWSRNLIPSEVFAGSYAMVAILGSISVILLLFLFCDDGCPREETPFTEAFTERPLLRIIRQPIFVVSSVNSVVGTVVMMFVMAATPLAAVACHHSIDDGANIVQLHLVGMFGPSLAGAFLIRHFGVSRVLFAGMLLNAIATFIAVFFVTLPAFYVSLLCLGIGWNFMFVGGSTLLARSHSPAERGRAQGVAEFLRYGATAVSILAAGPMLEFFGWSKLNFAMLPLLILCAVMTYRGIDAIESPNLDPTDHRRQTIGGL